MFLTYDAASVRDMLGQRCGHVIVLVAWSRPDRTDQVRDDRERATGVLETDDRSVESA